MDRKREGEEKAPPMGTGHIVIPFPSLHPVRIVDLHAQVFSIFLKLSGLGIEMSIEDVGSSNSTTMPPAGLELPFFGTRLVLLRGPFTTCGLPVFGFGKSHIILSQSSGRQAVVGPCDFFGENLPNYLHFYFTFWQYFHSASHRSHSAEFSESNLGSLDWTEPSPIFWFIGTPV